MINTGFTVIGIDLVMTTSPPMERPFHKLKKKKNKQNNIVLFCFFLLQYINNAILFTVNLEWNKNKSKYLTQKQVSRFITISWLV